MIMTLYGIVGAGGFGREVIPLVEAMLKATSLNKNDELVFVTESPSSPLLVNHYRVLSIEDFFAHPAKNKYFNIAISDCKVRRRIAELMIAKGAKPFTITASNSVELGPNEIGVGAIFCPYTTITANAKIGKFFHANLYSYVAHDCIIGDYVTFAPHVHCNGNVKIEDDVYVGTGVIIKQGTAEKPIVIGKGAILGMGAVVTKSVAPHETVVGNPARRLERKDSVKTEA